MLQVVVVVGIKMMHVLASVEEQLIVKSIKEECNWEDLSKRLQAALNSKEEWHKRFVLFCFSKIPFVEWLSYCIMSNNNNILSIISTGEVWRVERTQTLR